MNAFGPRYPSRRRADILRNAQLGVRVRTAEAQTVRIDLTDTRRGCLQAIAAGKVKHYPTGGWKCDGKARNAVVRECVAAGWAREWVADGRLHVELTDLGRKAIGAEEPA